MAWKDLTLMTFDMTFDRGLATIDRVFKDKISDIRRDTKLKEQKCDKDVLDCIKNSGSCPTSFEHPCWKKRDECVKKAGEDQWKSLMTANNDRMEANNRLNKMWSTRLLCVTTK